MTDTDTIDAAKTAGAIAEYNTTEAALAELRQKYEGVAYDVTTTAGDQAARRARKELVTLRTSLEAKRKALKAPALEYSRRIDSEAARIAAEIVALEEPIDAQIKADEQRREAESKRKAEEESARIRAHQQAIEGIRTLPPGCAGASSASLAEHIRLLVALPIGPEHEEFQQQAESARNETLAIVRELHRAALAREAEVARATAEREELNRLRAEQAERERVERERLAAESKAEVDRQAAVRAEQDAREREQQEQQRRLDEQAAAQRAEQERIEREAAAARQRDLDAAELEADVRAVEARAERERLNAAAPQLLAACQFAGSLLLAASDVCRTVDMEGERYDLLEAARELARVADTARPRTPTTTNPTIATPTTEGASL